MERGLLAAATHKSRRQIEVMLAERFPQPDVATRVRRIEVANFPPSPVTVNFCPTLPEAGCTPEAAPASGEAPVEDSSRAHASQADTCRSDAAPGFMASPSRLAPIALGKFGVQFTMDEAMHADLERALALLAPRGAEDRVLEVFRRALRELVTKLEKNRPNAAPAQFQPAQPGPAQTPNARYIPARIRREVWLRDEGRCTFVGATGHRCEATSALEFDHVMPVARGGRSTTANLRLLCRAHNQYAAEQAFGEGFMHAIRERTGRAAAGS